MKVVRKLAAVLAGSVALLALTAGGALAQVLIDPTVAPVENNGGWVFGMAWLLTFMGLAIVVFLVIMYLRFAPRFATDEEAIKVVRADRVMPGQELPRRAVDVSQAAPMIVAPPSIPSAEPAPAPAAPAPAVPAPVDEAPAPAAEAAPAASTPAAEAATAAETAPAAPAPAAEAAPATPAPAPAAQHADVSLDEEVFEAKLQELLDAGTDRRIAEGKARRAAMIAARKKAAGEG